MPNQRLRHAAAVQIEAELIWTFSLYVPAPTLTVPPTSTLVTPFWMVANAQFGAPDAGAFAMPLQSVSLPNVGAKGQRNGQGEGK